MSSQPTGADVTGETILEAPFDRNVVGYYRWLVSGFLVITVVGILLIPFWLLLSPGTVGSTSVACRRA